MRGGDRSRRSGRQARVGRDAPAPFASAARHTRRPNLSPCDTRLGQRLREGQLGVQPHREMAESSGLGEAVEV